MHVLDVPCRPRPDNRGMPDAADTSSPLLAAIDIGSNSFRLEIGQVIHGRYKRVDYLKETVRLGGGLDDRGLLTEAAIQRGLDTLSRLAQRLAGFGPAQARAVATQTLREARNRDDFLARAQIALGLPVEVISGREEARLIYAGVAHLQPSPQPRLVIDIGGRSTEMILGHGPLPTLAESFQVGSVALSMRYFPDGRFTDAAFCAAQVAAGAELEEALAQFRPSMWQEALGASGTVSAVSQVLAASGVTDGRLTPAALGWCVERCIEAGTADALALPGLRDDRRPVIGGGLAILCTLLANFDIPALMPAKGALRQGVIVELHERLRCGESDLRDASVVELQHRFAVDVEQARRVRKVALARHAAISGDAKARRELGWACDLHEIGRQVSHHDYHRHGAYLVSHVDAPGFSQSEQRRIGELVLGQRGGLRKVDPGLSGMVFASQLLCLRLAVIECHARDAVDEQALRLERIDGGLLVTWREGWEAAHPRTLHLLRQEADAWDKSGALRLSLAA
jgi:exopolyphosphatase/guanosine-5'-triphosphate,3'-diphosphate pyrophosphatase